MRHTLILAAGLAVMALSFAAPANADLEPLNRGDDGYRSFRFRYLLPLTVEVQYIPQLDALTDD